MKLPIVSDLDIKKKKVVLRADWDVPIKKGIRGIKVKDKTRLQLSLKTINYLLENKVKLIIISHLNRPGGKRVPGLSLKPVVDCFCDLIGAEIKVEFSSSVLGQDVNNRVSSLGYGEILVLENLRFSPGERENSNEFAQFFACLGQFFVNEDFAVSHRRHASIVSLPNYLPSAFGFEFVEQVKVLSQVYRKPERPVVVVLGGVKESKLTSGEGLLDWADNILIGGKLVEKERIGELVKNKKIIVDLEKEGEDITLNAARKFVKIIKKAGTVVWSGPMGYYEKECYLRGTRMIAEAVASSGAYSVVGGGDTEAALTKLGLVGKVDYVCSGGGAMLAFLAQEMSLPGIEAIKNSKYQKLKETKGI